jgi:hypothetical protein
MAQKIEAQDLESVVEKHRPIPYGFARMVFCAVGLIALGYVLLFNIPPWVAMHVKTPALITFTFVYALAFAWLFRIPTDWVRKNIHGYYVCLHVCDDRKGRKNRVTSTGITWASIFAFPCGPMILPAPFVTCLRVRGVGNWANYGSRNTCRSSFCRT